MPAVFMDGMNGYGKADVKVGVSPRFLEQEEIIATFLFFKEKKIDCAIFSKTWSRSVSRIGPSIHR